MKEKTLLEKALMSKRPYARTTCTDDEIDLAFAWLKGEISNSQVCSALGGKTGQIPYTFVARALREAFRKGRIDLK